MNVSNGYTSIQSTSTEPTVDGSAVSAVLGRLWGVRVAEQRAAAALSQAALAKRCGVTQQTISKIERGHMVPLDPLKLRLATVLRLEPGALFAWPPGVGAPPPS